MDSGRDGPNRMDPPMPNVTDLAFRPWRYRSSRNTGHARATTTAIRRSDAASNVAAPHRPDTNATTGSMARNGGRRAPMDSGKCESRCHRTPANTMAEWPLRDPDYRRAKDALKATPTRCAYCHRLATTLDHVPPLALHVHRRGTRCCQYVPACTTCNCGAGSAIARAAARRPTASRRW